MKPVTIFFTCIAANSIRCTEARSLSAYVDKSSYIRQEDTTIAGPGAGRKLYGRIVRRGFYRPRFGYGAGVATGVALGAVAGAATVARNNYYDCNYYNNCDYRRLKTSTSYVSEGLTHGDGSDTVSDVADKVSDNISKAKSTFSDFKDDFYDTFGLDRGELTDRVNEVKDDLSTHLTEAKENLSGSGDSTSISDIADKVSDNISKAKSAFSDFKDDFYDTFGLDQRHLTDRVNEVKDDLSTHLTEAKESLSGSGDSTAITDIADKVSDNISKAKSAFSDFKDDFYETFGLDQGELTDRVNEVKDDLSTHLNGAKESLSGSGDSSDTSDSAKTTLKSFLDLLN